jgi:hypothetical protein
MPRKPTGRPRGRPAGTGQLNNPKRITVWLPGDVYAKLEAYADGRHYHRGEPQLAVCMRELLMHALACPYKQQTHNIPVLHGNNYGQIETVHGSIENNYGQIETVHGVIENNYEQIETITAGPENNYYEQTQIVPSVSENNYEQIETIPTPAENISRQIEIVPDQSDTVPAHDTTKFYLGKLCPKRHEWGDTGMSLLRKHNQRCRECENEGRRERRQAKRQEVSA